MPTKTNIWRLENEKTKTSERLACDEWYLAYHEEIDPQTKKPRTARQLMRKSDGTTTTLETCGTKRAKDLNSFVDIFAKATRRDSDNLEFNTSSWLASDDGSTVVAYIKDDGRTETWLVRGRNVVPKANKK